MCKCGALKGDCAAGGGIGAACLSGREVHTDRSLRKYVGQ